MGFSFSFDQMFRWGFVFVLLMGSAIVACEESVSSKLSRAEILLFEGQYEQALILLTEIAALTEEANDSQAEAAFLQSQLRAGRISHLFLNAPGQAFAHYRKAVERFPGSEEAFEARTRMADLHLHLGDTASAIAEFNSLVAGFSHKDISHIQYRLARTHFSHGELDQARTEANLLIKKWPRSDYVDRARFLVASTYQIQERFEEAIKSYVELRNGSPDDETISRARFEEAGCLASLGHEEEAINAYLLALMNHPEPRIVRMKMENLKARMSRRDLDNLDLGW